MAKVWAWKFQQIKSSFIPSAFSSCHMHPPHLRNILSPCHESCDQMCLSWLFAPLGYFIMHVTLEKRRGVCDACTKSITRAQALNLLVSKRSGVEVEGSLIGHPNVQRSIYSSKDISHCLICTKAGKVRASKYQYYRDALPVYQSRVSNCTHSFLYHILCLAPQILSGDDKLQISNKWRSSMWLRGAFRVGKGVRKNDTLTCSVH